MAKDVNIDGQLMAIVTELKELQEIGVAQEVEVKKSSVQNQMLIDSNENLKGHLEDQHKTMTENHDQTVSLNANVQKRAADRETYTRFLDDFSEEAERLKAQRSPNEHFARIDAQVSCRDAQVITACRPVSQHRSQPRRPGRFEGNLHGLARPQTEVYICKDPSEDKQVVTRARSRRRFSTAYAYGQRANAIHLDTLQFSVDSFGYTCREHVSKMVLRRSSLATHSGLVGPAPPIYQVPGETCRTFLLSSPGEVHILQYQRRHRQHGNIVPQYRQLSDIGVSKPTGTAQPIWSSSNDPMRSMTRFNDWVGVLDVHQRTRHG
ncbi:hypothetical protein FPOAC2_04540 [Fusarium poae]|jgi:hypothetical protein|uniref:hypothetical protein n=1 Tax=Fusarium poae TaxID=36050 RepID=UPI001CE83F27|nr:hypothetical protein FPOAC1_004456 [Fusarium poae]KAG8671215.1 hypothetical protein FPOAC1_004456 [Fusarium poae]